VTHDLSRKQFFAKLLGLTAAVGVLPKLLAKSAPPAAPVSVDTPVRVRPEARAVARRSETT